MMFLHDAWRYVKLLRDDSTEHLQNLLTILFAKDLPEVLQGDPLAQSRLRRKKTPFWLSCMRLLLERYYVWLRTNLRASRARRRIVPESLAKGQCSQVCGSSVCAFWGEQKHLDAFLQAYAVEKARAEARRRGHQVTEAKLSDGSIKLTIQVNGGTA
jgi:hypothetical protein